MTLRLCTEGGGRAQSVPQWSGQVHLSQRWPQEGQARPTGRDKPASGRQQQEGESQSLPWGLQCLVAAVTSDISSLPLSLLLLSLLLLSLLLQSFIIECTVMVYSLSCGDVIAICLAIAWLRLFMYKS